MENSIKTCEISLTQEEANTLASGISQILDFWRRKVISDYDQYYIDDPIVIKSINNLYHALSGKNHEYVESGKLEELETAFYASLDQHITSSYRKAENIITMQLQINIDNTPTTLSLSSDEESWVKWAIDALCPYTRIDTATMGIEKDANVMEIAKRVSKEMSKPVDECCYDGEQGSTHIRK